MDPLAGNMVEEAPAPAAPPPVGVRGEKKKDVRVPVQQQAPMSLAELQAAFAAANGQKAATPAAAPAPDPFANGYSQTTTPSGEQIKMPLGANLDSAVFSKLAGSTNQGDVMEAFRQQMARTPRSFTAGTGAAGEQVFNPETDAQYQARGMGQFKTLSDIAGEAEKQGLARVLGIGNLGVSQGRLGVDAGHLEVQQRLQQLNEQKQRFEMSKGATRDKLLSTLLTQPGYDQNNVNKVMAAFDKEHGGLNPAAPGNQPQPFQGNTTLRLMGADGAPAQSAPPIPGVGAPSPFGPQGGQLPGGVSVAPLPGAAAPGGQGPGGGLVAPAPHGQHPNEPDPSKAFGVAAVDAVGKPEVKSVADFMMAMRRSLPGGEQEFAQKLPQILQYAGTRFKQNDIDEFIQPSGVNALMQRFGSTFSKRTPDEHVLASQIRNAQGKKPSKTVQNEDNFKNWLGENAKSVPAWWGDLAKGGPGNVQMPAAVGWLQRALGGE